MLTPLTMLILLTMLTQPKNAHLNPNTRMNSKDEFRQGTNIIMQPVRGIGA